MAAPQTETNSGMPQWFQKFILWREHHVKEKNFVIFLSFVVGIFGGLAAMVLKWLIHTIGGFVLSLANAGSGIHWVYILCPAIGVVIVALYVRYIVKDDISHGVTRVLYAISQKKSRLKRHNIYTSIVASSVTIGFGGSVGAEGPIVYTGASIGSNLGSMFRLSPRILMILVGCGAAAGIAGIFKAPIAGMLFTLEVLMLDLTTVSVMPLLIASITSCTIAYAYTGYDFEFFFVQSENFTIARVPYALILGVACGLVSLYFTRVMNMMENFFGRFKNRWNKTAVGCSILSLLVFLFPPLYGEGYGSINGLLRGDAESILKGRFPRRRLVGDFHHALHCRGYSHESVCHIIDKRRRRRGRYIRAVALCRLPHRLPLRVHSELFRNRTRRIHKEFRPDRHGGSHVGGNARPAHGHLPHGRAYRRLPAFPAAAYRVYNLVWHY